MRYNNINNSVSLYSSHYVPNCLIANRYHRCSCSFLMPLRPNAPTFVPSNNDNDENSKSYYSTAAAPPKLPARKIHPTEQNETIAGEKSKEKGGNPRRRRCNKHMKNENGNNVGRDSNTNQQQQQQQQLQSDEITGNKFQGKRNKKHHTKTRKKGRDYNANHTQMNQPLEGVAQTDKNKNRKKLNNRRRRKNNQRHGRQHALPNQSQNDQKEPSHPGEEGNSSPSFGLETYSFPALGNVNAPSIKEHATTTSTISNQQGTSNNAVAWANVAATTASTAQDSEGGIQAKEKVEIVSASGMKLTFLRKERPPGSSSQSTARDGQKEVLEDDDITTRKNTVESALTDDNLHITSNHYQTTAENVPSVNSPLKQTVRLDMPKLRDRWWSLLHKTAEEKRYRKALQKTQEEFDLEEGQKQDKEETPSHSLLGSSVPQCQEYVELHPLSKERGCQAEKHPTTHHEVILIDEKQLETYKSYAQPMHKAILNHDEKGLETLLQLYKNKGDLQWNSAGVPLPLRQIDSEYTRLSPLQLAVKLDRPDLLRLLLREIAEEDNRARRQKQLKQIDNHADSLSTILLSGHNQQQYVEFPTPLMMAVELGHEECARLLFSLSSASSTARNAMIACRDKEGNNALHYCCRSSPLSGNDPSTTRSSLLRSLLHTVMDAGGTAPSKILSCKNQHGQTPLHVACQEGCTSLVETFLDVCSKSSCFSILMKILNIQDLEGQTPLLAAIASGSSDLVMTLLMWKGNHNSHHLGTQQRQKASQLSGTSSTKSKEHTTSCPLLWAVQKSANADMVRLLLEFHDPSALTQIGFTSDDEGYDLTLSLYHAVRRSASFRNPEDLEAGDDEMLDIVRILVETGANPCCARQVAEGPSASAKTYSNKSSATIQSSKKNGAAKDAEVSDIAKTQNNVTAVNIAAHKGHVPTLRVLLESLSSRLKEVKETRRRDPTLRKQPESFFRGLESMEEGERKSALSDGLATALYLAYGGDVGPKNDINEFGSDEGTERSIQNGSSPLSIVATATTEEYLACSLTLYRKGAQLGSNGLARLKCSLGTSTLKRVEDVITNTMISAPCGCKCHFNFRTGYHNEKIAVTLSDGREHFLTMQERSVLLQQMPWIQDYFGRRTRTYCPWTADRIDEQAADLYDKLRWDEVVLVTDDGASRLTVHGSIVSQNSAKLSAAVSFARLSREDSEVDKNDRMLEVDLGSTTQKQCIMLLQHLYRGSFVCGLPTKSEECCQELLDLLSLSHEFLCPSLAQEIEMRLLSSNPYQCFCWSCCQATTALAQGSKTGYQNKSEECIYIVEGPPRLVTPNTVLDVVAVSQHVGEALEPMSESRYGPYALEFSVVLQGGGSPTSSTWNLITSNRCLAGIREVTTDLMLLNFADVLQSPVFAAKVEENLSDMAATLTEEEVDTTEYQNEAPALLLQMCLDELASSASKEAFSVHSQSLKKFWTMLSISKQASITS